MLFYEKKLQKRVGFAVYITGEVFYIKNEIWYMVGDVASVCYYGIGHAESELELPIPNQYLVQQNIWISNLNYNFNSIPHMNFI